MLSKEPESKESSGSKQHRSEKLQQKKYTTRPSLIFISCLSNSLGSVYAQFIRKRVVTDTIFMGIIWKAPEKIALAGGETRILFDHISSCPWHSLAYTEKYALGWKEHPFLCCGIVSHTSQPLFRGQIGESLTAQGLPPVRGGK